MTTRFFCSVLVMGFLCVALPVSAAPGMADIAFNRGVQAYSAGNVSGAVDDWRVASNAGHVGASWLLGNLYEQGKGIPQDRSMAFDFFLRAARGGHPDAAIKVAKIFQNGDAELGIKRDYKKALPMYERAALAAKAEAQYELGKMYAFGEGVQPSPSEALRWQLLAAKKRYVPSFIEMSRLYFNGEGVTTDRVEGWMYLILADRFATPQSRPVVGAAMKKYAGRMKASDRDEARSRADAWVAANPVQE